MITGSRVREGGSETENGKRQGKMVHCYCKGYWGEQLAFTTTVDSLEGCVKHS